MKAVQITRFGGPEVLDVVDVPEPVAAPGHTLVRVDRAGINYADTHQIEDSYLTPTELPLVPGGEVAGTTEDGRRVVAIPAGGGGYAEVVAVPDGLVFAIRDGVTSGQALALVVQGVTAWHLLRTSTHLAAGETVVVHAAAGGVGTIAVQLARIFNAGHIIATASTQEKRDLAVELGADVAVDGSADGLRDRLIDANGGHRVNVVLEMVGGAVFTESLRAVAPFGRLATFGAASREETPPVDPMRLMAGSRTVAGFWLGHCFGRPEMVRGPLSELSGMVADGTLTPVVGHDYGLTEVRRAHEDMLARRTIGKLLLDPSR
ncbi:MAG TPA: NADPH:quinone oxidoreductase family protein [Pseudonocardiaceae bacterium]|jgi:NADPH2:quinone reductase|nr:NADPH:quinone oxidoreductase family protein [Pseudonocardiaceae bacterium]